MGWKLEKNVLMGVFPGGMEAMCVELPGHTSRRTSGDSPDLIDTSTPSIHFFQICSHPLGCFPVPIVVFVQLREEIEEGR